MGRNLRFVDFVYIFYGRFFVRLGWCRVLPNGSYPFPCSLVGTLFRRRPSFYKTVSTSGVLLLVVSRRWVEVRRLDSFIRVPYYLEIHVFNLLMFRFHHTFLRVEVLWTDNTYSVVPSRVPTREGDASPKSPISLTTNLLRVSKTYTSLTPELLYNFSPIPSFIDFPILMLKSSFRGLSSKGETWRCGMGV